MSDRFDFEVSVGNGGTGTASADGGTVVFEDVNTGGNTGNIVSLGDSVGPVIADAGTSTNSTTIGVDASGGFAGVDSSGGDNNFVFVS